jgi:uncharacterized membrane-anchored protein
MVNSSRVAQVGLAFWIIKILSTGLGETGADYLDHKYSPIIVVAVSGLVLLASLLWQLSAKTYSAVRYWLAVVMVSVFGTLAADAVHVALDIPYWASTAAFTLALVAIFVLWHRVDANPSMSGITTRRQELFYWCAVMMTFALGTASGDWLAMGLGLGFLAGAGIFALGFAIPLMLTRGSGTAASVAFWIAYTFTRPMGASFADWLALPPERGGIGLGTLPVTMIWLLLVVLVLVAGWIRSANRAFAAKPAGTLK